MLVAIAFAAAAGCGSKRQKEQPSASASGSAAPSPDPVDGGASHAGPNDAAPSDASPEDGGVPAPELTVLDDVLPEADLYPKTLDEQRSAMLRRMKIMLRLDDAQLDAARKVFSLSHIAGQGNPAIVEYGLTRAECKSRRDEAHVVELEHPVCGGPYMMPLYDPKAGETEADAKACIDEYEFPDMPCDYPVTWVSPREAAQLCESVGKRICDAHEWEGGCAGALHSPDVEYAWGKPRKEMKMRHNADREIIWAYGPEKNLDLCGTASKKSKKCEKSGWKLCGSNTFPSGSFPQCKSPLGVYDQHGNVAEHMNMPLKPTELASRGGHGESEMKGSWFIFKNFEAHEDDCRWRAPDWHATKLMDARGHANYHLGFRCCKSVGGDARGSDH